MLTALRRLFRPPPPPSLYLLTHTLGGPTYAFSCTPEQVPLCLYGVRAHGLSDVCRDALAEGIRRRPEEPARYGMWTLDELGGEV